MRFFFFFVCFVLCVCVFTKVAHSHSQALDKLPVERRVTRYFVLMPLDATCCGLMDCYWSTLQTELRATDLTSDDDVEMRRLMDD